MNKKSNSNFKRKTPEPVQMRLNRYIANSGICSRRDADELIRSGKIKVNNKVVTELGTKVNRGDMVSYMGKSLSPEEKVYLLLNKPKGYTTSTEDRHADKLVTDLVRNACSERVYPVGRLDKNTTGLLILTNDGDFADRLAHPKYNRKKIYHVFLNKPVTKADLETIASGIDIGEEAKVFADAVSYADPDDKSQVGIEIHSGQNRVVKRIFEALGYRVRKLDRVYFAGLTKKNLPRGKWRHLTPREISSLKFGKNK